MFRTPVLTVSNDDFRRVGGLLAGEKVTVKAINDIVSSSRGEEDNNHHKIRRFTLLSRALRGGHGNVKVTANGKAKIKCHCLGVGIENSTDCVLVAEVTK